MQAPTEDLSTEEKIKEAARKIFLQKGFAGTKIRDIAEEANINIALMNYYFRSKEKLFEAIFQEALYELLGKTLQILNDTNLSFEGKIRAVVANDMAVMRKNPLLPSFVFAEIHTHVEKIVKDFPQIIDTNNLHFAQQHAEGVQLGKYRNIHIDHIFSMMMGMSIQPFLEKPFWEVQYAGQDAEKLFEEFIANHEKIVVEMLLGYLIIK